MSDQRGSDDTPRWRRYLRFWGPDVAADVDDELQYHLDMRTQDFIAQGHPPERARRAALELFGDARTVRRALRVHDARKLRQSRRNDMLQDLAHDLRSALRQLRNAPRFSAAVVAVLALGIGANTAIFSAVDAALLRPLPFADPSRIVALSGALLPGAPRPGVKPRPKMTPHLSDFQSDRKLFSTAAAYATGGLNLAGGAEPIRVTVTLVTTDFFDVLGRVPMLGRPLSHAEATLGEKRAAVLSHTLWTRQFGSDPRILGRKLTLNDVEYEIVGVMGSDFTFPAKTDLWIGLTVPVPQSVFEAFHNFVPARFIARLAPGATPSIAAQRVAALLRQYRPDRRREESTIASLARPLQQTLIGDRSTALLILMGSAGLLLLIACANVTNLLLARAASRQREIALRVVLGATRTRVIRQLVVESTVLSVLGGLLAVAVAWVSLGALTATLPAELADVAPPRIDVRVLAFTMLLALGTTVLFGVWPAIGTSRVPLHDVLKLGGGGTTQRRGAALRGALVIAEISLALILVVGAGLLLESLYSLLGVNVGMRTENVVTARLTLPKSRYANNAAVTAFVEDVNRRLRAQSGVEAVGAVNTLPMSQDEGIALRAAPENAPEDTPRSAIAAFLMATPGYFAALGTPLRGEDLPATFDSTRRVAVINEAMAKTLWPDEDAIGKRLVSAFGSARTVVGIIANVRTARLDAAPEAQVYFPMAESPQQYLAIVARGSMGTDALIARIREAVRAVDSRQPVYATRTLEDVVSASIAPRRVNALLLTVFGGVALALAAIGVYAVLAYNVSQRTREFGVRVALGAQHIDVISLVLSRGVVLATTGIAIGLVGAYALSRYLGSILYETTAHDPRVFIGAPVILLAIALLATWLPARRATRIDPMEALREG